MQGVATGPSAIWWHPDVPHYKVFWECVDSNYKFFAEFLCLKSSTIECCHAKYHVIAREKWHSVIYSFTMKGTNTLIFTNSWLNAIHLMREFTMDVYLNILLSCMHGIAEAFRYGWWITSLPPMIKQRSLFADQYFRWVYCLAMCATLSCYECAWEGNEPRKLVEAASLDSLEKYSEKFITYIQLRIST